MNERLVTLDSRHITAVRQLSIAAKTHSITIIADSIEKLLTHLLRHHVTSTARTLAGHEDVDAAHRAAEDGALGGVVGGDVEGGLRAEVLDGEVDVGRGADGLALAADLWVGAGLEGLCCGLGGESQGQDGEEGNVHIGWFFGFWFESVIGSGPGGWIVLEGLELCKARSTCLMIGVGDAGKLSFLSGWKGQCQLSCREMR